MLAQILSARPTGGNKLTDEELLNSAIDPEMLETGESLAQVNPVMQTQSVTNNKRAEMWSGNASVSWQIIKGLTFKSAGTYNTTYSTRMVLKKHIVMASNHTDAQPCNAMYVGLTTILYLGNKKSRSIIMMLC